MILDYTKLALKNLRKRRLRSWLTMLGIFISIATIFVLISVSLGFREAVTEQFRLLGTDKFFIQSRGQAGGPGSQNAAPLTIKDAEVIEKIPGVKAITYNVIGNAKVEFASKTRFTIVVGFPLDNADIFTETGAYKADEGRMLRENDEGYVMLGSQYKYNNLFPKPVHAGDKITINEKVFKVETILQPIGNPGDDRLIYMSLEDFKTIFNLTDRVDQILIQVDSQENLNDIAERVDKKLLKSRGLTEKTRDFTILSPEELLESFGTILNILTAFLAGIAAISLLVGSIGIANTMYTSVLERTKEIGIMKSVGAQNKDILLIFLIESGLLGLIGGAIGVVLGIIAGKIIEFIAAEQLGTTLLRVSTPFYLIAGCLLFSFLVGAISGVWPAWRASRIKPVDALRYE